MSWAHSPQVDRETTKNGTHDKPNTFQYYKSTHQTMRNMIGVFTKLHRDASGNQGIIIMKSTRGHICDVKSSHCEI